jgi:molybdopterin molybdotransferase
VRNQRVCDEDSNRESGIMISVQEADAILQQHVQTYSPELCPLHAATGRILREAIRADRPLPPYDRVAMDGIAVSSRALQAGVRSFHSEGTQKAGAPPAVLAADDGCLEVMTGAVLPVGTDCVIPIEDILLDNGKATLRTAPQALRNVHLTGSDAAAGTVLIEPGTRLDAALIGIAASVGRSVLQVGPVPRIAVVSTGDELVPVEQSPLDHQVRCSNVHAVRAALQTGGFVAAATHHFADDERLLLGGLDILLQRHDVLVLSGGVSMGRFDFVPSALARLGVQCHFHRVRQKPGKPLWFGTAAGGSKLVFGLPGNPVSALVCAARYLLPALQAVSGLQRTAPPSALLTDDVTVAGELTMFVPARLRFEAGRQLATPVAMNGSGDFSALAAADGFVEVVQATRTAGSVVTCHSWR